jgi:hypothetical protein
MNRFKYWGIRKDGEKIKGEMKSKSNREGKLIGQFNKLLIATQPHDTLPMKTFGYKKIRL